MMLSSLSSLAHSTSGRSASFFPFAFLKFFPDAPSNAVKDPLRYQAAETLGNVKQLFQTHFPTQSQRILQHRKMGKVVQNALTVLIPIHPDKQVELRQYLDDSADAINRYFSQSSSTHFARFVVLQDEYQGLHHPHLLFSSTYDGKFNAYMDQLVGLTNQSTPAADILDNLLQYCEGYTPSASRDINAFSSFIRQHAVGSNTFFMAYWGKSVPEIHASKALYDELHQALENPLFCKELNHECDRLGSIGSTQSQKPSSLPTGPLTKTFEDFLEKYWVKMRPVQNDPGYHLQPNATQLKRRQESKVIEDRIAQNQFLTFHSIDPGFLRINILILKIILLLAAKRAKKAKGNLSGIPTIHSLRWVVIPPAKHRKEHYLLFESNYNGSWDSYVDDFVQYACRRMNLIWGKCKDYRSQGAQDAEWFKQHIRNFLFPAQVYYSAYPDLTVRNILTCLRVAEVVGITPNAVEIAEADRTRALMSLKLLLAGAYHSIN